MDKYAEQVQNEIAQLKIELDRVKAERDQLADRLVFEQRDHKQTIPHNQHSTSLHEWLTVIDAIKDPIFVHDQQFKIVLANQAYADIAETPITQVKGRLYWELFPRGLGPMASCIKALNLHCEQHEEIIQKNGQIYISRSFPIQDINNNYVSSVHIFHNVTEQRRLEAETRIQNEALEHSAEAVLILNNQHEITYTNSAFCKLFGYDKNEILGSPLSLLSTTGKIAEAEHEKIIDYIRQNDTTWSGKILRKTRHGHNIPVYLSVAAIKDSQGEIIGFVKNYLDLRAVNQATQQVEILHAVIEDLSTIPDLDTVGSSAIKAAMKITESDTGFICLLNEADNKIYHHWHVGLTEDKTEKLIRPYDIDEGLTSQILSSGKAQIVDNYPKHSKTIPEYIKLGIQSAIGIPISVDNRAKGVLFVASLNRSKKYSIEQIPFLEAIARQIGVGLQRKQLINELEESRKYLNHIVNTVPDIIYQGKPENFSTPFVSHAVSNILGFSPEDFMNDPTMWKQQIHLDDAQRVIDTMQKTFNSEASAFDIEYRVWHKDGKQYRWIADRGTIERDEHNTPLKIFGAASDITDQKSIQQELEDSQARYSDLFNNIKSGVAVFKAIEDGNDFIFSDFNRAGENIEHISKENVINHRLLEIFPGAKDIGFTDTLKRIWKSGEPENFPVFFYQDGRIQGWRENAIYRLKTGEVVAVYDDITERKQAEISLDRVNRALKTLSNCNHILIHAHTEQDLLDEICQNIVEDGGYPMSCVCYLHEDGSKKKLHPVAQFGFSDSYFQSLSNGWEEDTADHELPVSPEIRAITRKAPFIVHNIPIEQSDLPWVKMAKEYDCTALICLPIINNDQATGTITILAKESSAFDDDEVKLLSELAADMSYGIVTLRSHEERKNLEQREHIGHQRLQDSLVSTIQAIATSMEKRDPYTAGHQRNVAKLATAIAREMTLPEEQINGIMLGALIHDIGKIYVPSEILTRPGKLTNAEFEIIKSHPEVGYEIIQGVDFPWPVNEIVLQHHERLDGSGYPHGLTGDDISLEARILAVADVVEAMASHRPYRPGLGLDAALNELQMNRGILYDRDAVDKCIQLFIEKEFSFEE
ncbi:MAG: HD domain-containing phosphohydrolase [Gammaproteobacteria bacterium]